MIAILVPLTLLLVWNMVYCGLKTAGDFRSGNPAMGIFGLLAIIGVGGLILVLSAALVFGLSGV